MRGPNESMNYLFTLIFRDTKILQFLYSDTLQHYYFLQKTLSHLFCDSSKTKSMSKCLFSSMIHADETVEIRDS